MGNSVQVARWAMVRQKLLNRFVGRTEHREFRLTRGVLELRFAWSGLQKPETEPLKPSIKWWFYRT